MSPWIALVMGGGYLVIVACAISVLWAGLGWPWAD